MPSRRFLSKISNTSMIDEANDRLLVSAAEKSAWNAKQAPLVSGSNIKTINGVSIVGSGDLVIDTGGGTEFQKGTFSIPTTGWVSNPGGSSDNFNLYKLDYAIANIVSTATVDLYPDPTMQGHMGEIGFNPSITEYNGGITVYSNVVPSTPITGKYFCKFYDPKEVKGTFTIPTAGWSANAGGTSANFNLLKLDLTLAGVTASSYVDFSLDPTMHSIARTAGLSGSCTEYAGGITLYSNNAPASPITGRYNANNN